MTDSEKKTEAIDGYLNLLRIQAAGDDGWATEVETQLSAQKAKLEALGVVVSNVKVFKK